MDESVYGSLGGKVGFENEDSNLLTDKREIEPVLFRVRGRRDMRIGGAYYPEHWPDEKWAEDFQLMREANMSFVRMGEFAWCKLEPKENHFVFGWLDRAIDLAAKMGLDVVLGTPTAGVPAWLAQKHPGIFKVDEDGRVRIFGGRNDYCVNQPIFQERTEKIVRAMASHFGRNASVIGWQIDNEPGWNGIRCYCDECQRGFREWLRRKYGSIENLNRSWGTIFGGQEYGDWSQIPLLWPAPLHNPALLMDSYRFFFDSYVRYIGFQSRILRELSPGKFVTTNIPPLEYDGPRFAQSLDFISFDCYPTLFAPGDPMKIGFLLDQFRGYKQKNFWVLEQQAGIPGDVTSLPAPEPGQIRLWTYQSVAHGADAVAYFRWRTCLFGAEQFWQGILNHSRHRDWRYDEVKRTGEELLRLSNDLVGSKVDSQVAVLYSHETAWAFGFQPHLPDFNYRSHVQSFHKALYTLGIPCDIIYRQTELGSYRLILAPSLWLVDDATMARLRKYVSDGGFLVATMRTAVKDANNNVRDILPPAQIAEIFGIAVTEYKPLKKPSGLEVSFAGEKDKDRAFAAEICAEKIECKGADTMATYRTSIDDRFNGCPAVTYNTFGKGVAIYVGTVGNSDFTCELLKRILRNTGIKSIAKVPEGVEVIKRVKNGCEFIFVLNHSSTKKKFKVYGAKKDLLTGCDVSESLMIEPYGVQIIVHS